MSARMRDFVPWEIYYEKKKEDFAHLGSAFTAKAKAHSSFAQLSDKKKLKYIREAETRYDAYKVSWPSLNRPVVLES